MEKSMFIIILFIIFILLILFILLMKYYTINKVEGFDFIQTALEKNITVFEKTIKDLNRQLDDISLDITPSNIPSSVFTFNNTTTKCAFSETATSPIFGCNIKPGKQGEKGLQGNQGMDGERGDKGSLGTQGETGHAVVYQSFHYK